MPPTSNADINELLHLREEIQNVLGNKALGLYLYGSLVWGDFDDAVSDIDLLTIVSDDLKQEDYSRLEQMHRTFAASHPLWDDRIEVQYASVSGLKTFRTRSSEMAVISPGEPFHVIEAGSDWLMNWYFVLEYGVALFGPPPGKFIEPISKEEFIIAVRERAFHWHEHVKNTVQSRPYQSYAVLTLCRALYTLKRGDQVSKQQAALWAKQQLPQHKSLIDNALQWRLEARQKSFRDPEATYAQVESFVHEAINKIQSSEMYFDD